jgi:membrane protein implicated in regulation of membrane protease activity
MFDIDLCCLFLFIPFVFASIGCLIGALVLGLMKMVTWVWWVLLLDFFVCGLVSLGMIMCLFPTREVPEARRLIETQRPLGTTAPLLGPINEVP